MVQHIHYKYLINIWQLKYYDLGSGYNNNNIQPLTSSDILYYLDSLNGRPMIKTPLEIRLLDTINMTPSKFAWVKELGHKLIKSAEIVIDGQVIDKHSCDLLHLLYTINRDVNHDKGYNMMIGNTIEMYTPSINQKSIKKLYIPLRFWFNKDAGNALPLNNAIHTNIVLNMQISDISDVLYIDPDSHFVKQPKLKCGFLCQYMFLEDDERIRMANSKLEYLIERYNYAGLHTFSSKSFNAYQGVIIGGTNNTIIDGFNPIATINIKIFDPIKYLIWYIKFYDESTASSIDIINWNTYGYNVRNNDGIMESVNPILQSIELKMGGVQRESPKDEFYFTYVVPDAKNLSSLNIGEYVYSYALHPLILQPSGAANYSEIPDCSAILTFTDTIINKLQNNLNLKIKVEMWGCAYNTLRFISGMAGLTFVKTMNN